MPSDEVKPLTPKEVIEAVTPWLDHWDTCPVNSSAPCNCGLAAKLEELCPRK